MCYRQDSFDRAQRAYDNMTPDESGDEYEELLEDYVGQNSECPFCHSTETTHVSGRDFTCDDCDESYEGKRGSPPKTKAELDEERAEYLADMRKDEP